MMGESEFWEHVDLVGGCWSVRGGHRLFLALRGREPREIVAFSDRLGEVLHRLDLYVVAKQHWQPVERPGWFPRAARAQDRFLHARCAAVIEGRTGFEAIMVNPRLFARSWDTDAGALLDVAVDAYEAQTGLVWDRARRPPFDPATRSNGWGWGGARTRRGRTRV